MLKPWNRPNTQQISIFGELDIETVEIAFEAISHATVELPLLIWLRTAGGDAGWARILADRLRMHGGELHLVCMGKVDIPAMELVNAATVRYAMPYCMFPLPKDVDVFTKKKGPTVDARTALAAKIIDEIIEL